MGRREFITLLGGATAWPFVAFAQLKGAWRLGALLYSDPQSDPQMAAIRRGLSELGYAEGRSITIGYRYAEGHLDRLPNLAAQLRTASASISYSSALVFCGLSVDFNEIIY
jgi:putative tryptophan/tyrosine transport system substrate-binding protein